MALDDNKFLKDSKELLDDKEHMDAVFLLHLHSLKLVLCGRCDGCQL